MLPGLGVSVTTRMGAFRPTAKLMAWGKQFLNTGTP